MNPLILKRLVPLGGRDHTRMKVRMRDNFTCQDCKARRTPAMVLKMNRGLQSLMGRKKHFDVHHMKGLCGKKTRAYDKVDDLDGMITLCHRCHYNRPEHTFRKKVLTPSA